MTTRGLVESDFDVVADFLDRGIKIASKLNTGEAAQKLKVFKEVIEKDNAEIKALQKEVVEFASKFPMP